MERSSEFYIRPLRRPAVAAGLLSGLLGGILISASPVQAQVRTKKPDRGSYQSPVVGETTEDARTDQNTESRQAKSATKQRLTEVRSRGAEETPDRPELTRSKTAKWGAPLEDTDLIDLAGISNSSPQSPSTPKTFHRAKNTESKRRVRVADSRPSPKVKQVAYEQGEETLPLRDPSARITRKQSSSALPRPETASPARKAAASTHRAVGGEVEWIESPVIHAHESDRVYFEDAGAAGLALAVPGGDGGVPCDAIVDGGCDSMSGGCPLLGIGSNVSLSLSPERWFCSAEILTMRRNGNRIPALVTTGPDTDPDTAGELGVEGTVILVGDESILRDVTAGGRFTVGTWLDNCQDRSLIFRSWFAGRDTYGFSTDQDSTPVIARPFFNVSDGQAAEEDTQLVAYPDRSDGSISVRADSDVYGGDLSIRQQWYRNMGLKLDLFYGYQYMRLKESLGISNSSVSLDDNVAPLGSTLAVRDLFQTENTFHGGQLGLTALYREGCWSFRGLTKVGFGSLNREANLQGSTTTTIDGNVAVDNNGLLVRSTNQGRTEDHTFGWIPEFDFTLGWHRYPQFDVTVGYHVILMTDALQPDGTIDTNVNLSDPPTGQQSPARSFRYDTFFVEGVHFGLAYIY